MTSRQHQNTRPTLKRTLCVEGIQERLQGRCRRHGGRTGLQRAMQTKSSESIFEKKIRMEGEKVKLQEIVWERLEDKARIEEVNENQMK